MSSAISSLIIALDGPAGAGKSTIAKKLAHKLGVSYIDSGAIYRTLTYIGLSYFSTIQGQEEEIANKIKHKIASLQIQYKDNVQFIYWENKPITDEIHSLELTKQIHWIANNPTCRDIVNQKIREIASSYSVVVDGRDIGTVVFPNTPYKFYLDASLEERAKRRALEKKVALGTSEFNDLKNNIEQRDQLDKSRSIAPLKQADDAIYLDTSFLSIEQVVTSLEMSINQIL